MIRVVVTLCLVVAACEAPQAICGRLTDKLNRCGFPVTSLDCSLEDYATLKFVGVGPGHTASTYTCRSAISMARASLRLVT